MSKRDTAQYKIEKAAEMVVGALPPITRHPGEFIRDTILPEWGLSLSEVARRIKMDRASLHNVLAGKHDVSRDLAYKLGALLRDEVADLLIAYQHAYNLDQEQARREGFKADIERMIDPDRIERFGSSSAKGMTIEQPGARKAQAGGQD